MLHTGQILHDRYQIQLQLGHNAGRYTFQAQDLQTEKCVVVKVLSFDRQFQWEDLKLFEREAATLKALSHSAIPYYLDSFDVELPDFKGFAMVQTYINARSLKDWATSGRSLSEIEIQQIAGALLEVLIYLHDQHPPVIHRDIKPSNVLLTNRSGHMTGEVYLIDFGSVQTRHTDQTRTVVGSYGYMPIEQFGGRSLPASDLYSLGATLISLITGTHPADLLKDDQQIEFEPGAINSVFVSWLKWLTKPQASQRPQSAKIALDALDAIGQVNVVTTQPDAWFWDQVRQEWMTRSPIKILSKPECSKINLRISSETLELVLPHNRLKTAIDLIGLGAWTTVWNISVLSGFVVSILSSNFTVTLFLVFLVFVGLFMIYLFVNALYKQFLHTRFYINRSHFILYYTFLGFKWSNSCSKTELRKLIYVPLRYEGTGEERKKIGSNLYLQLNKREISLGCGLSEDELGWLKQELGDWLGMSQRSELSNGQQVRSAV